MTEPKAYVLARKLHEHRKDQPPEIVKYYNSIVKGVLTIGEYGNTVDGPFPTLDFTSKVYRSLKRQIKKGVR